MSENNRNEGAKTINGFLKEALSEDRYDFFKNTDEIDKLIKDGEEQLLHVHSVEFLRQT